MYVSQHDFLRIDFKFTWHFLLKMQLQVRDRMLDMLPSFNFPESIACSVKNMLSSSEGFKKYSAWPGEPKVDISFTLAWKKDAPGSVDFLEIVSQLIYSKKFFPQYKQAIRASRNADDFLEYPRYLLT